MGGIANNTDTANGDAPDQLSSPPSVSDDVRRLGLGRSSSPAKRSLSQRDEDDDHYDTVPRSPVNSDTTPTKLSHIQHVSPMPSRTKPIDQRPETRRVPSVDMLAGEKIVASSPPPLSTERQPLPTFDEQVMQVKKVWMEFNSSSAEGLEGHLISSAWLARVLSRTTDGADESFDKSAREGDIGPVDNRDLLPSAVQSDLADLTDVAGRPFVPLKPGLTMGNNFEILPKEAWNMIVGWYGLAEGSPVITRYMHNTAADGTLENLLFELYPPLFTIQKIAPQNRGLDSLKDQGAPAVRLVASRSEGFQRFLGQAKERAAIETNTKVRVWKVIETLAAESGAPSGLVTPIASRNASPVRSSEVPALPKLLVSLDTLTALVEGQDRELVDVKDETDNPKYNGSLSVGTLGFMETQTLILEEGLKTGEKGTFLSDKGRLKKGLLSTRDTSKLSLNSDDGRRSPTPGIMTRGRHKKRVRGKGSIGLQNLGNTCYMNSALQCIRGVEELTIYFLAEAYKADLNTNNPLGHNGNMAKSYAGLIAQFYESNSSFSPRNFRTAVGRCQPLFSGYGQQDSQEFLSFLIDALHEDLNRIQKKPYIENPDSDDKLVHDPEYVRELGETYRSNHAKRNASIAMDLFTGFYKNTMVCPECDKVSVTFDPYAQVTLQIPVENSLQHELFFAPADGPPIMIDLDIDYNSSIKQVKEYVAARVPGIDPKCLVVAEEYNHKFYKLFDDREVLSEANIAEKDIMWVFELDAPPTNVAAKKQRAVYASEDVPSMTSPVADLMAVPVLHKSDSGLTMSPTLVLFTREEAQDEDKMLRKLLRRIQTMTTRDLNEDETLNEDNKEDGREESDAVMTSEEDASSDDPNVQAQSIDSEDDVVDVKMREVTADSEKKLLSSKAPSRFLDPDFFIDNSLRNMFDIRFIKGLREIIPTNVPSSGSMPRDAESLQSRLMKRQPQRRQSSVSSKSIRSWRQRPDDDSSEDELAEPNTRNSSENSANTLLADSSDEDDAMPPPIPRRAPLITRKPVAADPYLVRLGECIILDWNSDAFDGLFRGRGKNDLRGLYTNQANLIEKLSDPALEDKRERLLRRKRQGVTLQECFTETARSEILSEDNAWYCNRCKEMRRATKTLELWTAPDILIVHLKRFNMQSRWRDKIDAKVDFPIEGLDLAGKVGLPEDKSLVYDLFAVDKHFGGLGGGHYTAVAKNFMDGRWYDYNDSSVCAVNPDVAVDKSAYLLFYRRRTDGPLGPQYLQDLVNQTSGESLTRSSSESGEGQRLGGPSSPSGSSNGSRAATAAHQPAQTLGAHAPGASGGSGRGNQAKNANFATALDKIDSLPRADEDEGISMDADHPLPSAETGGLSVATNWSWATLDDAGRATNSDDDETLGQDDTASLGPANGSPSSDRMKQFDGDDDILDDMDDTGMLQVHHMTTPETDSFGRGLVGHVDMKHGGAADANEDEDKVHDIRLGSDGELELEGLLDELNVPLLQLLEDGQGNLRRDGRNDALLLDAAVEHHERGDAAGHADQLGHGADAALLAGGPAVLDERRGARLAAAVGPLDAKLVLQHDHVALARPVLHLLLERGAQRVERGAARRDGRVAEHADPAQAGEDALLLGRVGEAGLAADGPLEVLWGDAAAAGDLGGCGRPGQRRRAGLQVVLVGLVEEAELHERADELGEAAVAQGAAHEVAGLGDGVALAVGRAVAVRVADEVEARHAARGPGELVAERVVGRLGRGQAAAEGEEGGDLAAGAVNLVDGLDGVQVVDARVEADLVEHGDAGCLGLVVELLHLRVDVRGGDHVDLVLDGRLEDGGVEGVGNERDDDVLACDGGVEGGRVVYIDRDGLCVLDALAELAGAVNGAAGDGDGDASRSSCSPSVVPKQSSSSPQEVLKKSSSSQVILKKSSRSLQAVPKLNKRRKRRHALVGEAHLVHESADDVLCSSHDVLSTDDRSSDNRNS
ncbi:hypothetical protein FH972_023853 [Carpinus fangiana]|uniref:ubiquitinyl hydrolase 1 n=1 Tax=Carpinus fangiana TaxID=176857 RepID=A0A5N6KYW1_9ROSI|nr:hypothetical protein FH972_023853 [Carpinus fangiana]